MIVFVAKYVKRYTNDELSVHVMPTSNVRGSRMKSNKNYVKQGFNFILLLKMFAFTSEAIKACSIFSSQLC